MVNVEINVKYANARFLPLNTNYKEYTFATNMEGLEPGDTVFYLSNDVLHEVIFVRYVKKPRRKYHFKYLVGRRCRFVGALNESIATTSE